jgi:hypothetical protein
MPMGFNTIRAQWICSPLVGWALLSGTMSPSLAQAPLDPDASIGPNAPGAGGSAPSGAVPGTIVAPGTTTTEGTQPGTPSQYPPGVAPTAGSTSRPADTTPSSVGFAGAPNPQIAPRGLTSETGVLLYGAPAGASIPTFSGGGETGDELGIALGAFTLYPGLDIITGVDSNAFAQNNIPGTPPVASPYTAIVPSLELRSNWLNHELHMALTGGFGFYANAPTQNYQNYAVIVEGKVDIREDFYLTPGVGYRRATEALGTPNVSFAQAPTVVESVPLKFGVYQRFNRLYYEVGVAAARFWYTDYSTITAAGLPGSSRDRYDFGERFRLGYEITDDVALYVQPTFGQIRYINPTNAANQERDSNNTGFRVGATWIVDPTTSFDFNIGSNTRTYRTGDLSSTNSIVGSLAGAWNLYAPLTLHPYLSRSIEETALSDYKSMVLTALGLDFNYLIHDVWTAIGGVSYSIADFAPVDTSVAPRSDKILRGRIGFFYQLRPQVGIGPVFEYTQGSSTDPTNGPTYERETISIRLTARR